MRTKAYRYSTVVALMVLLGGILVACFRSRRAPEPQQPEYSESAKGDRERADPPPRRRKFETSRLGLYCVLEPPAPWGDYGDILMQGSAAPEGFREGPLQLQRSGPFVPPISFPAMASAVVTAALRRSLEAAGLRGLKFGPVIKEHIVEIDWQKWDPSGFPEEELTKHMPNGEPEELLDGPHSKQAADAMGDLWELLPDRFDKPPPDRDVFRHAGRVVVTSRALEVLSAEAKEWFETASYEKCVKSY